MSEIRDLLANAQSAEQRGDTGEAARLLREAATYYRDRSQLQRAAQMLRQARRAEGVEEEEDESVFGFEVPEDKALVEQREPKLADPSVDAWCSFCCRPKAEVGPLVGGPTGSFICASCTSTSAGLTGRSPTPWRIKTLTHSLPSQRRATERLTRLRAKVTLVIGPPGSGKSAWLASLGDVHVLDASTRVALPSSRDKAVFLCVTAEPPQPALVLRGEHGPEPIHDTATLATALPHLDASLVQQIDAVFSFEAPDLAALTGLARAIATDLTLPDDALTQLVALAHRSGRGAHELVALLARIPSGSYS